MSLAMYNENSGTCILLRGWLDCGVRWGPFVFLCLGWGCLLEWISQICFLCVLRKTRTAKKNQIICRAELCRPRLPWRSDAEIFIRCLFLFFFLKRKLLSKLLSTFNSKPCRLCVWWTFSYTGSEDGMDGAGIVSGLCIRREVCKWRDEFLFLSFFHLELIFSWELQLMLESFER